MSDTDDVTAASERFYAALSRMAQGSADSMSEAWEHTAGVTALHPVGGREEGWDAVAGSFAAVAGMCSEGRIEMLGREVRTEGDLAYETGTESGRLTMAGRELRVDHRVTNIYHRSAEGWRMVHHHTDISPALLQIVEEARRPAGG
ncbi:YybH family protein [Limimaricola pyoseonensis]|uniref:Ketosteroid isomerase homolog n=1 Tax=Limimaricola pyoseonensis TaxID=521013 RepID=A0A1G7BYN0_9RHOB|nr:nuclear transport factor 2 family protein [Limimaricola pyoseonensis]SDE32181.1 Ketosteroid isomerase homolog [Limimaricola pyoseonensis]